MQSSPDHYPWDDDFVPGDCVREARELAFDDLKIVDCSEIHRAEVFASFQVPDGDWPGDKRIKELADDGCRPKLRRYAKPEFQNGDYWFFHASADTWARGDRTVVCIAVFDEPRTDSIAK